MKKYFLLITIFASTLLAHPHTFIEILPTISAKNTTIEKIHIKWRLDEMTSQLLVMEFDQNMNGKIDKKELIYIKENFFDSLEKYNYYSYIKINNKSVPTKPKNFKASIEKQMFVIYEFDLILNANKNDLQIDFSDDEMFTGFILKKEFVKSDLKYKVVGNDYFAYRLVFN